MNTKANFTFSGNWEFELQLDSFILFDDFISNFESENIPSEGKIRVSIDDDLSNNPDPLPQQMAAVNFIIQEQQQILGSIFQKLTEEYPRIAKEYHASLDNYPEPYLNLPELNSVADLGKVIRLKYLHVAMMHKDGYSYTGLGGNCAWDEEHGVGFLMHKDRIVEFGEEDISFSFGLIHEDGIIEASLKNENSSPQKYSPHPKYGRLKPSQQEANEAYEERLLLYGFHSEFISLVENHQLNVNEKRASGMTFLERATQFDKTEMVHYLFSKNALPTAKSLHFSAENCNKALVELHLQHGMDINQFHYDIHILNPLVQKLVFTEYNPEHKESKDYERYVDMIHWLRTKGADPYLQNKYGRDVFYRLKNLTPEVREKIARFLE